MAVLVLNGGAMIGISVTALMDINVMLVQVAAINSWCWFNDVEVDSDVEVVVNVDVDFGVYVDGPQSDVKLHLKCLSQQYFQAQRIFEVVDRKPKIDCNASAGLKLNAIKGNIDLKGARFSYPTR